MAQNLLKELLKQDQEPFHLKDYITNKQHQLKKHNQIQLNKQKPLSKKHPSFFCKNACFLSLQNSPDIRKSPLFEFTKSPCKSSPNRMFLTVPTKTASLLLEAAMRIQKQTKPNKKQAKNSGLGLFGSVFKRLMNRKRSSKTEENRGKQSKIEKNSTNTATYSSFSLSYLDSITCSSSGRSINGGCDDEDEFAFTNLFKNNSNNDDGGGDNGFCLSPFPFALRTSPSPELRSPVMCSPVKSPISDDGDIQYEQERSVGKLHVQEDEEEKEQNSPVSVLDPPFEDDYDGHEEEEEEEEGYDLECSYAFVQRAKHHLLHKLQRFEKLAELDPIELEKRLIDDELDYEEYDYEPFSFDDETRVDIFIINDLITKSGFQDLEKPGIKRLMSDLIIEEEMELDNEEQVIKRVCKRLESWKEVEANTIDMMVGMDLRREIGDWKNYKEQIDEIAKDFEVAYFAILVNELVNDLISS